VAKESQSGFFRVQSLATNTVLPFTVSMNGASEVPAVTNSSATASGAFSLEGSNLSYYISFSGLSGPATAAHLHAPANATNTAGVMIPLNPPAAAAGTMSGTAALTQDQITNFVNGIRGQRDNLLSSLQHRSLIGSSTRHRRPGFAWTGSFLRRAREGRNVLRS
jgi:CHRD domain-containing protein